MSKRKLRRLLTSHKGTLADIILYVLSKRDVASKQELIKSISVSKRSIQMELSKHYKTGLVLSVSRRRGGKGNLTTVSLNDGILSHINGSQDIPGDFISKLASALARADSTIRRSINEITQTVKKTENDNENRELRLIETKFPQTVKKTDKAALIKDKQHVFGTLSQTVKKTDNDSENGGLDTLERPKTGPDEGNLLTSCIYNKDTLFNTVKENAKKKVKENQRHKNSTVKCDEKSTSKLGAKPLCGISFTVRDTETNEVVNRLCERIRGIFFTVWDKTEQNKTLLNGIASVLCSMAEGLINLSSSPAIASPPFSPTVAEPEVQPEVKEPPVKAKRGRKPKDPSTRKWRKSRRGKTGSFPDDMVPEYEELSVEARHPMYDGYTQPMLNLMFAREYCKAIQTADTGLPLHNIFTRAANSLTQLQKSSYYRHFNKARLRADSYGSRYGDYVEALFEMYWKNYEKFKDSKTTMPKYPQPRQLYGEKALEYLEEWLKNQMLVPYERDVMTPEFWPENYTGTPEQLRYYGRMIEAVRTLCNRRHIPAHIVFDDLICRKIMSQEFAEDPKRNGLMPGYRYRRAA